MSSLKNLSILGAGQAAVYAASEFRKHDQDSIVTIFGDENYLPYERPPLSKDFLINKKKEDEFSFFSKKYFEDQNINFINEKIETVDFKNRSLLSNDNNKFSYDKLLITTGSTNRKLTIDREIDNKIFYLRNLEEAKKIKDRASKVNKIAIIGGGFIGLEIASSLNQQNKSVSLIEISKQLMGRIIPSPIANLVKDAHEQHGNKLYINSKIKNIQKTSEGFKILLDTNDSIDAEMIIGGIGSSPTIDLFSHSDLKLENGIFTDEYCQTSIEDVYAAGDVSNFYHPLFQQNIRLESFQHAQNHGISAGKNIAGIKSEYLSVPWMWSDQFNLNLQLTGLCNDYDEIIVRGDRLENGIIYFFIKNQKIAGACGLGLMGKVGRDIRIASKLIEKNTSIDKKILSAQNEKLNALLKK
jgi:3-phenylpropionate/trans-cinnamate dioxygenase ferredoxin reductase subunit|tara:strand:+ start:2774 stop:4009 length:1236 start_codon:yes stop_codon:yes gene_type:complete